MEQKEDVGTKDVEPSTPRDWSRWLTERARATEQVPGSVGRPVWLSVDQARRLALVLEGLTATVAQLEAECHRLQEQRPSPSWRVTGSVTPPLKGVVSRRSGAPRCEVCVHRAVSVASNPCRTCLASGMATEYRPDPALEGGRHE